MDGRNVSAFLGDYDYYLGKKDQLAKDGVAVVTETNKGAGTEAKNDWQLKKERDAALRKQKNRMKRLEEAIAEVEALIERLGEELGSPLVASDYQRADELYKEKEEAEGRLLELYEEYEEGV